MSTWTNAWIDTQVGTYPMYIGDMRLFFNGETSEDPDRVQSSWPTNGSEFDPGPRFKKVMVTEPAQFDPTTHKAVETSPALIQSEYKQQWRIDPLTQDELDANAAHEQMLIDALSCTPRQGKLAMLMTTIGNTTLLDMVEAARAQWPREIQITWDNAVLWERRDPLWDSMGSQFDPPITPEQVTALFQAARGIT